MENSAYRDGFACSLWTVKFPRVKYGTFFLAADKIKRKSPIRPAWQSDIGLKKYIEYKPNAIR